MHTLADVLTLQCTWPTQLLHVSNTGAVSALKVSPLLPHLYRMLNTTYKSSLAANLQQICTIYSQDCVAMSFATMNKRVPTMQDPLCQLMVMG